MPIECGLNFGPTCAPHLFVGPADVDGAVVGDVAVVAATVPGVHEQQQLILFITKLYRISQKFGSLGKYAYLCGRKPIKR
jgi:hypothetical protein